MFRDIWFTNFEKQAQKPVPFQSNFFVFVYPGSPWGLWHSETRLDNVLMYWLVTDCNIHIRTELGSFKGTCTEGIFYDFEESSALLRYLDKVNTFYA
jgi:hypothetical protein